MKKVILFSIPVLLIILSFQQVDTLGLFERPPMREYYLQRMEKFHNNQRSDCQTEALSFAMSQVDSVLTGKKLLVQIDSFRLLPRPEKPVKPEFEFEFEIDSMPVDPLFDTGSNGAPTIINKAPPAIDSNSSRG